jgi:hypothetical protein
MDRQAFDRLTLVIIQAAIEVHKILGLGFSRASIENASYSNFASAVIRLL